jgi:hypothetical protein
MKNLSKLIAHRKATRFLLAAVLFALPCAPWQQAAHASPVTPGTPKKYFSFSDLRDRVLQDLAAAHQGSPSSTGGFARDPDAGLNRFVFAGSRDSDADSGGLISGDARSKFDLGYLDHAQHLYGFVDRARDHIDSALHHVHDPDKHTEPGHDR